ncbi:hypothetical protein L7F22_026005 [Adiantum nelumboides]|nr:hypothetical protein [Adiantum nelumboides]
MATVLLKSPFGDEVDAKPAISLSSSQCLGKSLKWSSLQQTSITPMPGSLCICARAYTNELIKTSKSIASPGCGILAIDESNATCRKRLASIALENNETNRQAYMQLLCTALSLGQYISGAIRFEETLYQSTVDIKKFVICLKEENIIPRIKVDKGLVFLLGSNNESWCQGLASCRIL